MDHRAPSTATLIFRALAVAHAIVVTAYATPAAANGRIPAAGQIALAPNFPDTVLLRTTFGLLVSRDRGTTWDWVCERGMRYGGDIDDPSLALLADGTLLASTLSGLSVSHDSFCGFSLQTGALQNRGFIDVTVRPNARQQALALASDPQSTQAGEPEKFTSNLFYTLDNGQSFTTLGNALDTSIGFETVEVAPSDSTRIYLSGSLAGVDGGERQGVLLVSRDSGASYTQFAIPLLLPGEKAPFVSAVAPTNADRLYVRTAGAPDTASRLLVSDDAGATFREVFRTRGPMLGLAVTPNGQTIYAGSAQDGLYAASTDQLLFEKRSSIQVRCLAATDSAVWACSTEVSGFVAGVSFDNGHTFEPKLHLGNLRGPLTCPANSSARICEGEWPALRSQLGIHEPGDGGGTDAGADRQGIHAGGGCSAGMNRPTSHGWVTLGGGLAALVSAAFALLRARRKRLPN